MFLKWTAILTVQAGDFLQQCLNAIWPSFINFPNHLPENAGITSAGLLCFFLYWFIQSFLSLMPIGKLRLLFWVKGVVVPPTFFALFLWAVIVTHGVSKSLRNKELDLTISRVGLSFKGR
jgi:NCS1 family nucleobase:cation symporter-1